VQAIRTEAVKRVLRMLEELGDKQPEKYATFWTAFGRVLKEGVPEDPSNTERIAKLLRFSSPATTPTRRPCRWPPTSAG
jgi:molecular chaperone HtpG